MFEFGSGNLYAKPLTGAGFGNPPTNPTPVRVATLQDVSIDIGWDLKELYGQKQFPEAVARGKAKIAMKAKFARFYATILAQIVFSQPQVTPMKSVSVDESWAIPATPFTVTVTNAATFQIDLGVVAVSTGITGVNPGINFTAVASGPTSGQYSVNTGTGVYTFAAADTGKTVLISYLYTAAAGVGQQINVTNQFMGYQPQFQVAFDITFQAKEGALLFYNAIVPKIILPTKNDDFLVSELDIACFADVTTGKVLDIFMAD